MAMSADEQAYDVQVEFIVPEVHNRFWAVPVLGIVVKLILLIPHLIILSILGQVAALLFLVTWIPVLFGGRYPSWGYELIGGTLRWNTNVNAYLYGLTDRYPPFRFGKAAEGEEPYEVDVDFTVPEEHNLFWAIPVIGILVKLIILIPHMILLYVIAIVASVLGLVTWIPVLFNGHYPDWGYEIVGGYLRYYARVGAYTYGLTDQYPPFRLGR